MEKRIVLSFILSFAVLILWQSMFPQSKREEAAESVQVIENKELTSKSIPQKAVKKVEPLTMPLVKKVAETPEVKETKSNGKISVNLSTDNGGITEATILAYDATLPVTDVFALKSIKGLVYEIVSQSADEVVFMARQGSFEVRKTYRFSDEEYIILADIQVRNIGSDLLSFNPSIQTMLVDVSDLGEKVQKSRDRNLMEYSVLSEGKVVRKTGAYKFLEKERKQVYAPVEWFGFRNRYYCMILKPNFDVRGYEFAPQVGEKQLNIYAILDDVVLNAGETVNFTSKIYVGPQNSSILKEYGENFEKIQVYFRAAFFDSIAKIIEDVIKFVHKILSPITDSAWGFSIILVSMLIYLAMYPMTMKSMMSMRKMQSLQPKIVELREKHEKNPQKLNQEIMKLYGENKVNPIGGCLPLLLQMPVFICLYQMIWRSVMFKGAKFFWIADLSRPDMLTELKTNLPIIDNFTGGYLNVLPIIILVLMVVQQKMTSKNMASSDPNQVAQQKMMMFMMPAVLLLVFYKVASGLSLYLTVFYILSSFTQWRVGRKVRAEA